MYYTDFLKALKALVSKPLAKANHSPDSAELFV
jgi:hypothetical protein